MAKPASRWDVHPAIAMVQTAIAGLHEKTGRSLDEWIAFVERKGPRGEAERTAWLKSEQGLGTNYAKWIAARSLGKGEDGDANKYLAQAQANVETMFAGPKGALRPVFDRLVKLVRGTGKDVRVCPCATIVPAFRNHVFAQIKPSTRTRIDFGLALKDLKTPKRLVDTGGFAKKDRITRKFEITSLADIDDDVKAWTKRAYDMDA
jgi:hypothetical protein